MRVFIDLIIPVIMLSLLAAGWMGVQLLAKKWNVKNHIDNEGGCCGACDLKEKGACDNQTAKFIQ